jgi:hypothetical protein
MEGRKGGRKGSDHGEWKGGTYIMHIQYFSSKPKIIYTARERRGVRAPQSNPPSPIPFAPSSLQFLLALLSSSASLCRG